MPTRCYSYTRFSTPEQEQGDSHRRQVEGARAYAARRGWELDETKRHDAGVSAFRGKNAREGALREFLDDVEANAIPKGSVLLVENADRLSRQNPWDTIGLLGSIVNRGVTVATMQPEREFTARALRSNAMLLMELVFTSQRANEESERKSGLIRAAWAGKRQRAAREPLTAVGPAWLEPVRGPDRRVCAWRVNEARAAIVRRIYAEALKGTGQHAIAEALNREGVPVFGRGRYWHRSYVVKLLSNPAVVGTLVPHTLKYDDDNRRTRTPIAGGELAHYYPSIIDPADFAAVKALREGANNPRRGRNASAGAFNLFGGLAVCARCGGPMTMTNKGKAVNAGHGGRWRYLVCSRARTGAGCRYTAVRLQAVEDAFLHWLPTIVHAAPAGNARPDVDAELDEVETQLLGWHDSVEQAVELMRRGRGAAAEEALRVLDTEKAELDARRGKLVDLRDGATPAAVTRALLQLEEVLSVPEFDRTRANALARAAFSAIRVDPDSKTAVVEYRHGGEVLTVYGFPDDDTASAVDAETVTVEAA